MSRIADSTSPSPGALRLTSVLALVFILSQAFLPAHGATYTMTLQTDAPSYSGISPIEITGTVSPAPGPDTAVIVSIRNQAGSVADIMEVTPSPTDGSFSYTSHPGGNAAWTSGTFAVNATWGGDGSSTSEVVTFNYTAAATSTTSSTSTSSNTSSSASRSSSSTISTSSRSSESSSASATTTTTTTTTTTDTTSAPEFPPATLAVVALIGVAAVALLSRRVTLRRAGKGCVLKTR